jgi:hypothetical protein
MKNRLYIQLGRAGDILNVLPLLQRDAERSCDPPVIMVAREFAALLEGITYAHVVVWPGAFNDILGAYKVAEVMADQMSCEIICTQIYGNAISGPEHCTSFMRQSWDQVPGAPPWGTLPLLFDHRDLTRERGVKNQLVRTTGKPYIVTALSGTSSPFPHAVNLLRYLRAHLSVDFEIVDISGFMAPRFYDLITLLEDAHAVVAVDSGVLHLMHAAPRTPVVAFVTREPSPWHGTPWRANHVGRFYYDEAPECFMRAMNLAANPRLDQPSIFHAWTCSGQIDPETSRRMTFARNTWKAENDLSRGRWHERPLLEVLGLRTSYTDEDVKDTQPCPFIKDVITRAAHGARPFDVIAYTNADVCFTPGLTGWVLDKTARQGCAFTHRWDYHARLVQPFRSETEVAGLDWYPGSDAFFFTVAWWRKHRDEMPDMICGREKVDEVLRQLIKRHGGLEIHCAIYHEKHPSFWEDPDNFEMNPGNQHNRRLARKWFLKTGYAPDDHDWWQIPATPI